MQLTKVLRGCLAAYLVGTLAGWLYILGQMSGGAGATLGGHLIGLGAALWFGLPLGVALSAVVVLAWAGGCLAHLRVAWWMAPVLSTVLILGLALLMGEDLARVAPFSLALGVAGGLAFWGAAFGLHRGEQIEFRPHEAHAPA